MPRCKPFPSLLAALLALLLMFTVHAVTASGTAAELYRPADKLLAPDSQRSFAEYVRAARRHLEQYKVAVPGFSRGRQIAWSLPFEMPPASHCNGPRTGLLLFHGLSDTPFVFRDLARALAERCVQVRVILLPGHGTRPGDLVAAESDDWFAMARSHLARFRGEVDRVFVGGHSVGGAIATVLALEDPAVQGLVAIAPSWELNGLRKFLWLATMAEPFIDFIEKEREINPVKYESLAVNAGDEVGEIRAAVQVALRHRGTVERPALVVATEADSVINLDYVQRAFRERFIHERSRLVLYRDQRRRLPDWWNPRRMHSQPAHHPGARILELSHQSLPIAPDNPLYGRGGPLEHCLEPNGTGREVCLQAPRDRVWYGAWHEQSPPQRIVSRLTWNPHFAQLVDHVVKLLGTAPVRVADRPTAPTVPCPVAMLAPSSPSSTGYPRDMRHARSRPATH